MEESSGPDMTPEELYEQVLASLPRCDDTWFVRAVRDYRAGDTEVGRRIVYNCSRIPFQIARERWRANDPMTLLDLVQYGNSILTKALPSFAGDTCVELVEHCERFVARKMDSFLAVVRQHPDMSWDLFYPSCTYNNGAMKTPDYVGQAGNAEAGPFTRLYLKVQDDHVTQAKQEARGCGVTRAAASELTRLIKHRSIQDCLALTAETLNQALGNPPAHKFGRVRLAIDALHNALKNPQARVT